MGLTPPAGVVGRACRIALSPPVVRESMVLLLLLAAAGVRETCNLLNGVSKYFTTQMCTILLPGPYMSVPRTYRPLIRYDSRLYL